MPACGRCTKAGQAANCLYIDDATDTPTRPADSSSTANAEFNRSSVERQSNRIGQAGDTLTKLEYQERRIKQLEAALGQTSQGPACLPVQQLKASKLPLTPESVTAVEPTVAAVNITDRETMLLRGKSFKTQFHGITHPGSLIAYIPELASFTKETFEKFPALARIRADMHALEERTEYAGSAPHSTTEADMRALLPSRLETDHLVQLYMDNYDAIYHVIHLPSFRQEYAEIWADLPNARTHFVAIVLLMTATSHCLVSSEPWLYTANSSSARERAVAAISLVEHWIQRQSQKRVTVADFQIRFLIVLAKLLNANKFKRSWTEAGAVLRFFMAAGLHRNPELLRKPTSTLDKEMRRRLWSAITEFELQASFWRGMVSAPWPQQSDCPPPSNIHDEDVDQTSEQLPSSRPVSEFTNTSYMILANETFSLRYTLNTVLNNIRQTISFEDAKHYTDEIEAHLRSLPEWIGTSSETPQTLLSTTLRQYLLVLHDRQFRQAASQSERNYSKMILIDTAGKIIEAEKALVDSGCRALQFLCHDQLRAALSVCHIVSMPDPQADTLVSDIVDQKAAQIMTSTIELVADKVARYGREQRQLWITLAANGYMKTRKDPSNKLVYMQEAVDKITRPYYRILACQEDAPTTIANAPPTDRSDMPNGLLEYLPDTNPSKPEDYATNDPPLLDFDEMARWTFEDWTFNPIDLPQLGEMY